MSTLEGLVAVAAVALVDIELREGRLDFRNVHLELRLLRDLFYLCAAAG